MIGLGWKVVVISFLVLTPSVSISPQIDRVVVENSDEAHLQQQLTAIADKYGSIAAFIYLQPSLSNHEEHAMIQQAFFLAKHLKKPLTEAYSSCFLTVAHLDGKLGTGDTEYNPIAGGLLGLTKALRWEWESVYCRAMDLGKDLDTATSVRHIVSELHDPNRLIAEVGYSSQGRGTLVT